MATGIMWFQGKHRFGRGGAESAGGQRWRTALEDKDRMPAVVKKVVVK
jgi:hypothetical protein